MGSRKRCRLPLLFFVALCACAVNAVFVEDGVYKDVLVTFSRDIPAENAEEILNSAQETLKVTSKVLKKAIGVGLAEVTLLVPKDWAEITTTKQPTASQYFAASVDVEVALSSEDSAFGARPLAVQFGGCGTRGLKVNLPAEFLLSQGDSVGKGKTLAKEWIKYRFGVFDEAGFPGDERYPVYYAVPGTDRIRVTDCTNTPLTYQYRTADNRSCTPSVDEKSGLPKEEAQCSVFPDEESKQNVESSLLFMPTLPKVEFICGGAGHDHIATSPNKQNVLCAGKSVSEVVKNSPDLKNILIEETTGDAPIEDPIFNLVQEISPRVVVAYDTTSAIGDKKGETIKTSIRRFLYDLPADSKCSFVRFSSAANVVSTPLQPVADDPKERWQMDMKLKFSFDIPGQACSQCAIAKALDILLTDNPEAPGSILIIPSTDPAADEQLLGRLESSEVCLFVVLLPGLSATAGGFQNYLDAAGCGDVFVILEATEDLEVYKVLYEALLTAVPKQATAVRSETVLTSYIRSDAQSAAFHVGPPSETVTLWLMPPKDIFAGAVQCRVVDARQTIVPAPPFEPPSLLALTFQSQENLEVTCSLNYQRDPVLMQVRSTSLPGQYLDIGAWTADTTPAETQDQMPVILYAKILLGSDPVLDAEVIATVTTPEGQVLTLHLLDTGAGDPDVTRNDGVYSRYFVQFTTAGLYHVQIAFSDNGEKAQSGTRGSDRCCGSRVDVKDKISFGRFRREVRTQFRAVSGRPERGYPPSRITDLRVVSVAMPRLVTLTWSAPGAEADQGTVARYDIKVFNTWTDASRNFDENESPQTFNVTENLNGPGDLQTAIGTLEEDLNQTYYIALRALNHHDQSSDTSNVVEVFLPDEQDWTSSTAETISVTPDDKTESESGGVSTNTYIIIFVTLGVVLLLIVLIYVIVFFFVIKPRRQKEQRKSGSSNHTTSGGDRPKDPVKGDTSGRDRTRDPESNDLRSVNSVRADVILNHHRTVQDAKLNKRPPPIFKTENLHVLENGVSNEAFDRLSEPTEDSSKSSSSNSSEEGELNEFRSKIYAAPKSPKRVTVV